MNNFQHLFVLVCFAVTSPIGYAKAIQGMSFAHQDWEIYCSNTGTCRAAGYQDDRIEDMPASLLIIRKAGEKQAVQMRFALSEYDQALDKKNLKNIHFYVNAKDFGAVTVDGSESPLLGVLNTAQVNGLLQQAQKNVNIVFKNAHYSWKISDAGMTASLLKMDDFQKRVGTVGALVKKGTADESNVLVAQPKLMLRKIKTASKPYLVLKPDTKAYKALYVTLMAAQPKLQDGHGFCEGIYTGNGVQVQKIELYKLSNQKVLATTLCWRGAYNEGFGAWVIDGSLKGKATFVTESASDFDEGDISSSQKGRGIGDCWSMSEWIWDGKTFVQSIDRWSGMCKGVAAGGVWNLDLIESVVR